MTSLVSNRSRLASSCALAVLSVLLSRGPVMADTQATGLAGSGRRVYQMARANPSGCLIVEAFSPPIAGLKTGCRIPPMPPSSHWKAPEASGIRDFWPISPRWSPAPFDLWDRGFTNQSPQQPGQVLSPGEQIHRSQKKCQDSRP